MQFKINKLGLILVIATNTLFIINRTLQDDSMLFDIYTWVNIVTTSMFFIHVILCIFVNIFRNIKLPKNNKLYRKKMKISLNGLQYINTVDGSVYRFLIYADKERLTVSVKNNKIISVEETTYKMITHRPKSIILLDTMNALLKIDETMINKLFEEGPRFHKQIPLYVLYGDSGTGKSWIGDMLVGDELYVYETDSVDTKEDIVKVDFNNIDIVVLGNKHKMSIDELLPSLPKDRDIIKVDFRKDY